MCRLTPQLAGRRKTAPAPTGGREQPSTTTWPTRTTSRKLICSCTANIGRLGRLKSCYDRGSRSGDRHLSFSSDDDVFRQEVRAFIRDHYALGDARPQPPFSLLGRLGASSQGKLDSMLFVIARTATLSP